MKYYRLKVFYGKSPLIFIFDHNIRYKYIFLCHYIIHTV